MIDMRYKGKVLADCVHLSDWFDPDVNQSG